MSAFIAFTPDGALLIAVSSDGLLSVVDPATGVAQGPAARIGGQPTRLLIHPDGSTAFVLTSKGIASSFDLRTQKLTDLIYRVEAPGTAAAISSKRLVLGTGDTTIFIYEPGNPTPLARTRIDGAVNALAMSPDGRFFASAGSDGSVTLWSIDGQPIAGAAQRLDGSATTVAVAPDSRRIAAGSSQARLRIWSDAGLPLTDAAETPGPVSALAWHPNGRLLAVGTTKGEAWLLDAGRLRPIGDPMRHDGAVTAIGFSADGKLLATGGEDGRVQVWAGDSAKRALDPLAHDGKVEGIAFSPNGATLATVASDSLLRRFASRDGKLLGDPFKLVAAEVPANRPAAALPAGTFTRVGSDAIVTVGGVVGVFTPIGGDSQGPVGADERANLTSIIDRLKKELASTQAANQQLQTDLTALRERPTSAADFASGVQQSLDELAQRMSTMRNPVSNFAVREFKLDASVFVQVTPTGAVEYRFIQPGDEAPPAAVSKLSMSVVPLPKDNLAGVWTPNLFQPDVPISALPGIVADQARKLEGQGTFSIGEFLQTGTRLRAQAYLEALLGVDRQRLALWAQQAALMTLRGVDGKLAQLLIDIGLGSFDAIAAQSPAPLVKAIETAVAARPGLGLATITGALAAQWIRAARQYLGLPTLDDDLPTPPTPSSPPPPTPGPSTPPAPP